MSISRWLLAALGAFVTIFALDFIIHGVILKYTYEVTSYVWRSELEFERMRWLMILGQIVFSLVFAWFYTKGYEHKKSGLLQGMRYGLYVGIILAAYQSLSWYVVLPIPLILPLFWLAGAVIKSVTAGAVVGLIYQ